MKRVIEVEVTTSKEGDFEAVTVDGRTFELPSDKPAPRQLAASLARAAARAAENESVER